MSNSGKPQKRAKSWAHKASGLVLVAWLNLALQPCVMAMEVDTDQDCPHCPTELSHDQDQNQGTVCSYVASYNYDSRDSQPKPKDLSPDAPIPVNDVVALSASEIPPKGSVRAVRTAEHLGEPPINVLHCVYLH